MTDQCKESFLEHPQIGYNMITMLTSICSDTDVVVAAAVVVVVVVVIVVLLLMIMMMRGKMEIIR